jgi:hypothetical protein
MKIHLNFTGRQWVSIDDPSVPVNVIWVHVNANDRRAQLSLQVQDGMTSAALMTAVKTHLYQCLSIPVSIVFQLIIVFCTLPKFHNNFKWYSSGKRAISSNQTRVCKRFSLTEKKWVLKFYLFIYCKKK